MKLKYLLSLSALSFSLASNAFSITLNFEDLDPAPASYDAFTSPYKGFTFSQWFYGPDTVYLPTSGTIDIFTDYYLGDPSNYVVTSNNSITRSSAFIFDGASFSGYSGVTFELFMGGSLMATSATLPDAGSAAYYGPTFLSSGYGGLVDTVKVRGVQGYYALDDFQYREGASTAPIPEPSTYAMLLLGLGVLGAVKARSRHSQD